MGHTNPMCPPPHWAIMSPVLADKNIPFQLAPRTKIATHRQHRVRTIFLFSQPNLLLEWEIVN